MVTQRPGAAVEVESRNIPGTGLSAPQIRPSIRRSGQRSLPPDGWWADGRKLGRNAPGERPCRDGV